MEEEAGNFRSYLFWIVATSVVAIVGVVGLVIIVDPYGLYGLASPRVGFNAIKPRLTRYQDEIKLTHAIALKPEILILGNSRAEIGFDPEGLALSSRGVSAYNLAIPGIGIAVSRRQLDHLHRKGINPKQLILGLEFLDFIDDLGRPTSVLARVDSIGKHPIDKRFWRFDCLFSLMSLKDALTTLIIQREKEPETMTSRGFNPLLQYQALVRNEGYYALFNQKAKENAKLYLRKASGSRSSTDFAHLRAILELAAQSGIDIKLFVYPYHSQVLSLFESAGLWPIFEDWKKQVTREVSALRHRYPAANVKFFDFSGYSFYNCERIPGKGDRITETRWYWEGGHFKKELGELVLERILSDSGNQFIKRSESRFGRELVQSTELANQRRIADERTTCLTAYPELFEESAELVATMRALGHAKLIRAGDVESSRELVPLHTNPSPFSSRR